MAVRIIPALAGNTYAKYGRDDPKWDHPRSRGEYISVIWGILPRLGSSPLSRGILFHGRDG